MQSLSYGIYKKVAANFFSQKMSKADQLEMQVLFSSYRNWIPNIRGIQKQAVMPEMN